MCIHRSTSGGCEGVKLGALPKRNTLKESVGEVRYGKDETQG